MATVAVYNMQGAEVGKMDLNDAIFGVEVNEHLVKMVVTAHLAASVRELRKQRHVLRYPEAEENHGSRREPVTQDRVQQELRSGQAVVLYSLQYREITPLS